MTTLARRNSSIHRVREFTLPQANGAAERAVQVAKRLLRTSDPFSAMLAYRNTPLDVTGHSPARLLMGRDLRTLLPVPPETLDPHWPDLSSIRKSDAAAKQRSKENFDKYHGVKKLPLLQEGRDVRVKLPQDKQWSEPISVMGRLKDGSYVVRNRRFLNQIPLAEDISRSVEQHPASIPVGSGGEGSGTENESEPSVGMGVGTQPYPVQSQSKETPLPNRPVVTRYGRIVKPVNRLGIS